MAWIGVKDVISKMTYLLLGINKNQDLHRKVIFNNPSANGEEMGVNLLTKNFCFKFNEMSRATERCHIH